MSKPGVCYCSFFITIYACLALRLLLNVPVSLIIKHACLALRLLLNMPASLIINYH